MDDLYQTGQESAVGYQPKVKGKLNNLYPLSNTEAFP